MKKILLLLIITPFLTFSQEVSVRTFPAYIGFMYTPDFPYAASNIGIDYHISDEKAIACNFKIRDIDLVDNSASVYDLLLAFKRYNQRNFFGTYGLRAHFWEQGGSLGFDDIEYIDKITRYSAGPEIGFGKRAYFSSYQRLFIEFGLSLAVGGAYVRDIDQEKDYDTGEVIKREEIKYTTLYFAPNIMFQIGCKF